MFLTPLASRRAGNFTGLEQQLAVPECHSERAERGKAGVRRALFSVVKQLAAQLGHYTSVLIISASGQCFQSL